MKNLFINNSASSASITGQTATNNQQFSNYTGKPIQFYKKNNIYYLILGGEFHDTCDETPIFIDLHKDLLAADKSCELHIFIQSPGGSLYSLVMLIEEIVKFANVVTICTGYAMSAGFFVFMLGREKYISPLSTLLYHSVQLNGSVADSAHTLINDFTQAVEREKELIKYLAIDKYLTEEEIEKGKTTDIYFSGKDCIERGWAKPYSEYASRLTFGIVADNKGNLYKSDEDGMFTKYIPSKGKNDKISLSELNGFKTNK